MKPDTVLPVVGLMVTIYLVTKLREALGMQAMFAPPLSRASMGERIAQGAQLSLGILFAIVLLTGLWSTRVGTEIDPNMMPSDVPIENETRAVEHSPTLYAIYRLLIR